MQKKQAHKYEIVKSYLLSYITENKLSRGSKIPSENELAVKFGLSRLTARQAITELVNEGVLYRQRGSGSFVNGRTGRIGVLMSYIDSYIFTDIVRGIDRVLHLNNMGMLLTSSGNSISREKICLENLISQGIDGLIYEPAKSARNNANIKLLNSISQRGIKIICINGYLPEISAGRVLTDDIKGISILVNRMISMGHRNIAGIFLSDLVQGQRRHSGFCQTLTENGLSYNSDNVLWYQISDLVSNNNKYLENFINRILSDKVTAICCYNDIMAQKVMEILYNKGIKVPDQVSVTGFDGFEISRLTAMHYISSNKTLFNSESGGLATVIHPSEQLGEESVKLLVKLINGEIKEEDAVIEMVPKFLDGQSLGLDLKT